MYTHERQVVESAVTRRFRSLPYFPFDGTIAGDHYVIKAIDDVFLYFVFAEGGILIPRNGCRD